VDSDKKGTTVADSDFIFRVREALEGRKIIPDGHTIFAPSFYFPHFTEEQLAEAKLIRRHKSDGTWKGSITTNGEPVDECEGVYNLSFLYWVASELGVTESVQASGRGFQAQELVGYITDALA